MPLVEHELFIFLEYLGSSPVDVGFVDSIVRFLCSFLWNFGCPFLLSIVLSVPPSVVLFFCPLCCLFGCPFLLSIVLSVPPSVVLFFCPLCCLFLLRLSFSFVHCVVCFSSIYDSDYQFALFKIFLSRCPFPLVMPVLLIILLVSLIYSIIAIYICFSQ